MKKIHFTGIGGAGMAPLAQLAMEQGICVSGSDSAPSAKSEHLKALGAAVFTGHDAAQVPADADLLVFSSAVGADNCERRRAEELGIPQLRRGEFLGVFSKQFKRVAAVSGSHGKSSITAMLTTILEHCGFEPGALIGAARMEGESALSGNGDIFVTEVDESDGTHVCVTPFLGIVPNIDGDHEWSVGGAEALKNNFRTFGQNCQHLLIADTPELKNFFADHPGLETAPQPEEFASFKGFMAKNAALAVKAAVMLGTDEAQALEGVKKFAGIERRMCTLCVEKSVTVLEDYAHHPTEVASSLSLVRALYPGQALHVIFQPHRYARLERFFDGFAEALRQADKVFVTPVFAAWSETGKVDGHALSCEIPGSVYWDKGWESLAQEIRRDTAPRVVVLLGAGDISELAALFRNK
jgi:UDP-N-acetylmuramate--alanine ligase